MGRHRPGRAAKPLPDTLTRDAIDVCDASLDCNPPHLDDDCTKGDFANQIGRHHHARHEQFRADQGCSPGWASPLGGDPPPARNRVGQAGPPRRHPALEIVKSMQATVNSRWVLPRRPRAQPGEREGRHREAMIAFRILLICRQFQSAMLPRRQTGRSGQIGRKSRVWIDIRPFHGLETARPGRIAARGINPILPLSAAHQGFFGPPNGLFKASGLSHEGP